MLQFKGFSKSYHNKRVISIEDAVIGDGIYWLKGVNGAGKSTLLKCITGFLDFQGDLFLDGLNFRKQGIAYRRIVNFGDAEPLFPDFLTGMEMVKLFEKAKGAAPRQSKHYVDAMEMGNYIDNPISSYSSGMVKKLSLVLAFLGQAKLICLDEPLITLDHHAVIRLGEWIQDRQQQSGTSFILSSHQPIEDLKEVSYGHITIVNSSMVMDHE